MGVTGVRSTGVTASVSIAAYVADILADEGLDVKPKTNFEPYRTGFTKFNELSWKEKDELIKRNPLYGHVICRCETVTEGQIVEAIHRPIQAKSLDAIKRRLWRGWPLPGRFLQPQDGGNPGQRIKCSAETITKHRKGSEILTGPNRLGD